MSMSSLEVFNSCPVGVLVIDKNHKVTYSNPEFSRVYGYSSKDFNEDSSLNDHFVGSNLKHKTYINDVSLNNIKFYHNKLGDAVISQCSVTSYNSKKIIYFNPLAAHEYFKRFDGFPNEVITLSEEMEVLYQNQVSIRLLGDKRGQKLPQSNSNNAEYKVWSKLIAHAKRKKSSVNQIYSDFGKGKDYRALCLPIYFADSLVSFTIVKLELTDTWTARKEEYLSQLKLLMEASDIYFILRDLKSCEIEYVSPYFRKIWGDGINIEELDFESILHEFDIGNKDLVLSKYYQHQSDGKAFVHEVQIKNGEGELRWVKIKIGFIVNDDGNRTKEYWIIEDVSNERALKYIIKNRENTISQIQKAINNKIGKENLDHLNYYLAEALGAEYFFLSENIKDDQYRILSYYTSLPFETDGLEYDIKGTPLENIAKEEVYMVQDMIQSQFPDDEILSSLDIKGLIATKLQDSSGKTIGILTGLFKKPIRHTDFAKTLIRLFSARAEAELERIHLDRSLKEREERYAHALDVGEFGIVDIDLISTKYNLNSHFFRIMELSKENLQNIKPGLISSLIHPDYKESFYSTRNDLFNGKSDSAEYEWKILTPKGKIKWVNGKHEVIDKTPEGKPLRVLSIFKEVTEIKEAEDKIKLSLKREKELNKKLMQSEEQLKSKVSALNKLNKKLKTSEARWSYALEGNGDTVWDLDLSTRELYLSERFYDFLGVKRNSGKLSLQSILNRIHPDHQEELASEINHCTFNPYPTLVQEVLIRNNSEEYIWVLIRGKVVEFDEEQKAPYRMVGTITDLSSIKMMKRELSIYEEMIKQNQNGILLTDLDGYIDFMNTTAFDLLKFKQHEILYKPIHLLNTNENKFTYDLIEHVQEKDHWADEVNIRDAKGEFLEVNISASLLKDDQGEPHGIVINMKDITEKTKLERSISQLEKEKLNNELLHQKELTEVMIKVQEDEKAKLAKELHDGIGQVLNLIKLKTESVKVENCTSLPDKMVEINGLLSQTIKDLKNITYELMPMSLQELGLEGSINILLDNYKSALNSSISIKSKIKLDEKAGISRGLSAHIYRIAQESINNSVKYAKASQFSLMLMSINERLHLVIEDNGVGFNYAKAYKKHDSYGLKNIRERAKLINGRLLIDTAPGQGFTLSLTVPLQNIKTGK